MTMMVKSIWHADVQQSVYREILECFSRPGEVRGIDHIVRDEATKAVLATLIDGQVSIADQCKYLSPKEWSLLDAKSCDVDDADFILVDGLSRPDFQPKRGSLESPEKGSTLLIRIKNFGVGDLKFFMHGPGVKSRRMVEVSGLSVDWLYRRNQWVEGFPLGVDILLITDSQIMAIPRTTIIELKVSS